MTKLILQFQSRMTASRRRERRALAQTLPFTAPMRRPTLMRPASTTIWRRSVCALLCGAWPLLTHCSPGAGAAPPRGAADALVAPEERAAPASPAAASSSGQVAGAAAERSLLEFLGIGRGERVADLGSGTGYSIERMAAAVGPIGVVYTRHDPRVLVAPAVREAAAERAGTLPENIVVMRTPDSAPFSAAARNLDLVTLLFAYHELVAGGRDRLAFNRAVFEALAPERLYVIAEHAAPSGVGVEAARAGRVEERLVRADVEATGFVFVEAAQFSASTVHPGGAAPSQYLLKFRRPK
jgi:predicted methyltransferase